MPQKSLEMQLYEPLGSMLSDPPRKCRTNVKVLTTPLLVESKYFNFN